MSRLKEFVINSQTKIITFWYLTLANIVSKLVRITYISILVFRLAYLINYDVQLILNHYEYIYIDDSVSLWKYFFHSPQSLIGDFDVPNLDKLNFLDLFAESSYKIINLFDSIAQFFFSHFFQQILYSGFADSNLEILKSEKNVQTLFNKAKGPEIVRTIVSAADGGTVAGGSSKPNLIYTGLTPLLQEASFSADVLKELPTKVMQTTKLLTTNSADDLTKIYKSAMIDMQTAKPLEEDQIDLNFLELQKVVRSINQENRVIQNNIDMAFFTKGSILSKSTTPLFTPYNYIPTQLKDQQLTSPITKIKDLFVENQSNINYKDSAIKAKMASVSLMPKAVPAKFYIEIQTEDGILIQLYKIDNSYENVRIVRHAMNQNFSFYVPPQERVTLNAYYRHDCFVTAIKSDQNHNDLIYSTATFTHSSSDGLGTLISASLDVMGEYKPQYLSKPICCLGKVYVENPKRSVKALDYLNIYRDNVNIIINDGYFTSQKICIISAAQEDYLKRIVDFLKKINFETMSEEVIKKLAAHEDLRISEDFVEKLIRQLRTSKNV